MVIIQERRNVMKIAKRNLYFSRTILFLTIGLWISKPVLYAQITQNKTTEKFEFRVVHLDNAEIKPNQKEYKGIFLTGVIVEIKALISDVYADLDASVASVTFDGRSIPASIVFISKICGCADVGVGFHGSSTLTDWTILIGKEEWVSGDDFRTMPIILKENGNGSSLEITFKENGRIQAGFIFQENLNNLKSLSLLGNVIELQQQTSNVKLAEMGSETALGITIKGVISDWEKVKKYICEDAFLQLVFLSKKTDKTISIDSQGHRHIQSSFPQVAIAANGSFTLQFENLDAGKYAIAAQNIDCKGALWIMKGKKSAEIKIRKNEKLPVTIELGEVAIPTIAKKRQFM
jgi:hypothetical protein